MLTALKSSPQDILTGFKSSPQHESAVENILLLPFDFSCKKDLSDNDFEGISEVK
jgi:hypothetical protein